MGGGIATNALLPVQVISYSGRIGIPLGVKSEQDPSVETMIFLQGEDQDGMNIQAQLKRCDTHT